MTEYNKAYTTAQAAEYVNLTPPTFRKYLRHLEEYYPHIQRDMNSNYRIFNEYDLAVIKHMINQTKKSGWTVKMAAEQAAKDKEAIYNSINEGAKREINTHDTKLSVLDNKEVLDLLRGVYESNMIIHEDNKRLYEKMEVLSKEVQNLKKERHSLIEYNNDEMVKNNINNTVERNNEDTEISACDDMIENKENEMEEPPSKNKKTGGFWARLFGRL